jgi:hypothetical protein
VSAWIAGAISIIVWSRRFRLWLGGRVYKMLLDSILFSWYLPTCRDLEDVIWWCILTMACICWRYMICIRLTVDIFYIFMMILWILLRRSVYFLNICIIRMFYRFNRNRALQVGIRDMVSLVRTSIRWISCVYSNGIEVPSVLVVLFHSFRWVWV